MNNTKFRYRWWKVIAYEITVALINGNQKWALHPLVKMVREECVHDWTKYKTQKTMDELDAQIEQVIHYYEHQRKKDRFKQYSEEEGETPLGGELRTTFQCMDRNQ